MAAMIDNAWTLAGTTANLHRDSLRARLDISRPDAGIEHVQACGRDVAGCLLSVRRQDESATSDSAWPLGLADGYVRGDDLVASYRPADDWPYSPQLYWSAEPLPAGGQSVAALSLLISVQTHLLDTWPRVRVSSELNVEETLEFDSHTGALRALEPGETIAPADAPCCIIQRLANLPMSYLEIMPASDFRELVVRPAAPGGLQAEWHVFADFLEKGVIRKARLQSAFVPREKELPLAIASCEAITQRPPPLTT